MATNQETQIVLVVLVADFCSKLKSDSGSLAKGHIEGQCERIQQALPSRYAKRTWIVQGGAVFGWKKMNQPSLPPRCRSWTAIIGVQTVLSQYGVGGSCPLAGSVIITDTVYCCGFNDSSSEEDNAAKQRR